MAVNGSDSKIDRPAIIKNREVEEQSPLAQGNPKDTEPVVSTVEKSSSNGKFAPKAASFSVERKARDFLYRAVGVVDAVSGYKNQAVNLLLEPAARALGRGDVKLPTENAISRHLSKDPGDLAAARKSQFDVEMGANIAAAVPVAQLAQGGFNLLNARYALKNLKPFTTPTERVFLEVSQTIEREGIPKPLGETVRRLVHNATKGLNPAEEQQALKGRIMWEAPGQPPSVYLTMPGRSASTFSIRGSGHDLFEFRFSTAAEARTNTYRPEVLGEWVMKIAGTTRADSAAIEGFGENAPAIRKAITEVTGGISRSFRDIALEFDAAGKFLRARLIE